MSLLGSLVYSLLLPQATHIVLPRLSGLVPSLLPPAPTGSPLYRRNYRWTFSAVLVLWLAYSFIQEGRGADGRDTVEDWYSLLGVPGDASEEHIKRAFRTLSRQYHPDRAGPQYEQTFILIRQAYEVLSDPTKRYAYERFGSSIVGWKCVTMREYMRTGILHSTGFYVASGGFMFFLSLLNKAREGAYWRHTLFLLLLLCELSLLFSSPASAQRKQSGLLAFLRAILPSTPPFMQIRLLHRIFASASIGISQLAGVWSDPSTSDKQAVEQAIGLVQSLESDVTGSFLDEVVPILRNSADPVATERAIQAEMEQVLIDRTLSSHPGVRPQWVEAMTRAKTRLVMTPRGGLSIFDLARQIPLPPSPPPSPRLGPRR